jgi:hypothetical protein
LRNARGLPYPHGSAASGQREYHKWKTAVPTAGSDGSVPPQPEAVSTQWSRAVPGSRGAHARRQWPRRSQ